MFHFHNRCVTTFKTIVFESQQKNLKLSESCEKRFYMKTPEISEIPEKDSTLALTPRALELARAKRVLVGFDGFVDEIVQRVTVQQKIMSLLPQSPTSPSESPVQAAGGMPTSKSCHAWKNLVAMGQSWPTDS